MKKYALISILGTLLLFIFSSSAMAQQHRKGHRARGLKEVTTVSGTVSEWTYNDDFIYDGFYIKSGDATYLVKYPTHLGKQIKATGNNLTVNGILRNSHEGGKILKMVSITGNGQTIYDQKPKWADYTSQETVTNGTAKIVQMQTNKRGNISGYILDNGVILRISPHSAGQLSQLVQLGSTIGYTGINKILKEGQVQAKSYKIVRCSTISVNGTQYLVK